MSTFFNFRNQGLQNSIVIRLICFNYRIKVVFLSSVFFYAYWLSAFSHQCYAMKHIKEIRRNTP